jgi:ribonuclease HI
VESPAVPAGPPTMLRGFTRGGVIHLLGGVTLPNGIFVKVVPE